MGYAYLSLIVPPISISIRPITTANRIFFPGKGDAVFRCTILFSCFFHQSLRRIVWSRAFFKAVAYPLSIRDFVHLCSVSFIKEKIVLEYSELEEDMLLVEGLFTTRILMIHLTWLDGIMIRDPDAGALPLEALMLQGTPIWWGHWYSLLLLLLGAFTTQIPMMRLNLARWHHD